MSDEKSIDTSIVPADLEAMTPRQRVEFFGIENLCECIADGMSLRSIARERVFVSHGLLIKWIAEDETRQAAYAAARMEQAETFAQEIVTIADERVPVDSQGRVDNGSVQKQKLRVDARKWVAAKLKPGTYGDKLDLNANVREVLTEEQAAAKAARLLGKIGAGAELLAALGLVKAGGSGGSSTGSQPPDG